MDSEHGMGSDDEDSDGFPRRPKVDGLPDVSTDCFVIQSEGHVLNGLQHVCPHCSHVTMPPLVYCSSCGQLECKGCQQFLCYDQHVTCHDCAASAPLEQLEACPRCFAVTCEYRHCYGPCEVTGCSNCVELVETATSEIWCSYCCAAVPPIDEESDEEPVIAQSLLCEPCVEEEYDEKLYEQLLSSSTSSASRFHVMPFPWEMGVLPSLLGDRDPHYVPLPEPRSVPGSFTEKHEEKLADTFNPPDAVRPLLKRKRQPWATEIRRDRQKVMKVWSVIVSAFPQTSVLGQQVLGLNEEHAMSVVADTFEDKATSTLKSRAYSVTQFCRWHETVSDLPYFPVTETMVYEYACYLRDIGAPPTRATRFRQALAFIKYVVGVSMDDDCLSSRRAAGASLAQLRLKRLLKQRDPLSAEAVRILEQAVMMSEYSQEVIFAGHMLYCLHCRCRYSDMMGLPVEPVIIGEWLEAATNKHKTANMPGRRDRLLPQVGLAQGLTGLPWAQVWLSARSAAGLIAAHDKPFLPVPLEGGGWGAGRMTIGEATLWLRELLIAAGIPRSVLSNVGMHSLKATLLSWCAKAAVVPESRKLLGGHIKRDDLTMIAYSRDSLAGPLRDLAQVVAHVAAGEFDPDADRSGRWKLNVVDSVQLQPAYMEPRAKVKPKPNSPEPADDSDTSTSGSSECDWSSNDEAEEKATAVLSSAHVLSEQKQEFKYRAAPEDADNSAVWQHRTRHTFHFGKLSVQDVLACGRPVSQAYSKCLQVPVLLWPRCGGCFGNSQPQVQSEDELDFN